MTPRKMNFALKIFLLILILLTFAGLYFANNKLTAIATETSKLKAKVDLGNSEIKTYEATKIKVDSLSYVEELANKVLPQEQEQSLTVAELSQFALRSRLSVAEITFADTTAKSSKTKNKTKTTLPKGVSIVPLTIKFQEGTKYENLLEFLKSVEQNRRKMQVSNISLTPNEKDRSLLDDVTVDLNLYTKEAAKTSSTEKKQ